MSGTFKFNFTGPEQDVPSVKDNEDQELGDSDTFVFAIELPYTPTVAMQYDTLDVSDTVSLMKGIIAGNKVGELLKDSSVCESDLVAGKYEGGFKLWECSVDLCRFLCAHYGIKAAPDGTIVRSLQGKRVLELGCGHGLPGILMMLAGAEVHFQDFNQEVISNLTMANVAANAETHIRGGPSVRFFAGDWDSVGDMLTTKSLGGFYDIILTAETLYSTDAQAGLLECIKRVLQPPHGVVFVAAKTYYFGVGGGIASFKQLLKGENMFECSCVQRLEDGASNTREILKLRFPESITPYFL